MAKEKDNFIRVDTETYEKLEQIKKAYKASTGKFMSAADIIKNLCFGTIMRQTLLKLLK